MSPRSYLIKFDSIKELKKYFIWKAYLLYMSDQKNIDTSLDDNEDNKDIELHNLLDDDRKYNKKIHERVKNRFAKLYIVGLKFWAGGIWGLAVYDKEASRIYHLLKDHIIYNSYHCDLRDADRDTTNYSKTKTFYLNDFDDYKEACEIYKYLFKKYHKNIINYETKLDQVDFLSIDNCKALKCHINDPIISELVEEEIGD